MAIQITGDAITGTTASLAQHANELVYTVPASTTVRIMYFVADTATAADNAFKLQVNDSMIVAAGDNADLSAQHLYLGSGDTLYIYNTYPSASVILYYISILVQTET